MNIARLDFDTALRAGSITGGLRARRVGAYQPDAGGCEHTIRGRNRLVRPWSDTWGRSSARLHVLRTMGEPTARRRGFLIGGSPRRLIRPYGLPQRSPWHTAVRRIVTNEAI